jgi:hypothetical protein
MERIVIEVNKATAKKWRTSTQQQKRKLAAVFQKALGEATPNVQEPKVGYGRPSEEVLQAHFARVQKTLPEYQAFLDRMRENAAARGLTDEILDELLKTDD